MRQAEQPAIPKRWVMCPRIGDMVAHTQFVALKTPLGRIYDPYLHPHHQFTPAMAVEQRNVTNIICLANTEKRYDATDREVNGKVISWDWIKCGQQAPTDERYREFEKTVKRILKENPSAVIGVHCTHGFNRTGFMIVRFLVETQKMDVIEALDLFKKARPPGIYKEDYVHRLLEVYKRSIDAYPFVKRKPNEIWMFPPAERTATYFQPVKSRVVSRNCWARPLASMAVAIRVLPDPSPYTHMPSQLSPEGMDRVVDREAAPAEAS